MLILRVTFIFDEVWVSFTAFLEFSFLFLKKVWIRVFFTGRGKTK